MSSPPEDAPPGIRRVAPQIRSVARLPRGRRVAVVKGQDKGRFMETSAKEIKTALDTKAERTEASAKYHMQALCATLARRGYVTLAPDAPKHFLIDWHIDKDLAVRAHRLLERESRRLLPGPVSRRRACGSARSRERPRPVRIVPSTDRPREPAARGAVSRDPADPAGPPPRARAAPRRGR